MAKRSHRKGHGTGVKDYQTFQELQRLPTRESLAPGKRGPQLSVLRPDQVPRLGHAVLPFAITTDDRTVEEKAAQEAWDARMGEIMKGDAERAAKKKQERIETTKKLAVDKNARAVQEEDPAKKEDVAKKEEAPVPDSTSGQPLQNGQKKAGAVENARKPAKGDPVPPRQAANVTSSQENSGTTNPDVRVNNIPVSSDSTTMSKLGAAARADAGVLENDARTAKMQSDYDSAVRRDAIRGKQLSRGRDATNAAFDRAMASWKQARQELAEEDRRKTEARNEDRFNKRTLNGQADWDNLGRSGKSDKASTDEAAKTAYGERLNALKQKLADLEGSEDFKNFNPNRQKDLDRLRKVIDATESGAGLTAEQFEAAEKKVGGWGAETDAAKKKYNNIADATRSWADAKHRSEIRRKYGLPGVDVMSNEEVDAYGEKQQKKERMALYGSLDLTGKGGAEGLKNFADNYEKLQAAGFDTNKAFTEALKNEDTKAAYLAELDKIIVKQHQQQIQQMLMQVFYCNLLKEILS